MFTKRPKTKREKKPELKILNTSDEFADFGKLARQQVFPKIIDLGFDLKRDLFAIAQPYSSGHYIAYKAYIDKHGVRKAQFLFGENIKNLHKETETVIFNMTEQPGFLDLYLDETKDQRKAELKTLMKKINEKMEEKAHSNK